LLIGEAGTQKTASIILYAAGKKGSMLFKRLNFSSATTPQTFQEAIEQSCDFKSGGNVYTPQEGK